MSPLAHRNSLHVRSARTLSVDDRDIQHGSAPMNCEQLHALLPDLEESAIDRALQHERVRSAVRDLEVALRNLRTSPEGAPGHADWELTRDELLTEIRRLTLKFDRAP